MDTSGFSTVGRYGTISLMKRNELNTVVTAFGIDSEELTFGRDPSCSVRLYYPDVSLVHCKIMFEERKAFLVVLGPTGLLVDGCEVFPSQSPSGSSTMVPLSNNSEIEIHNKRFRFSYPPKDMRATLLSTPQRPNNRALRLSMIHSAQVFSPRPSNDPRENLRILKSPLKNTFKSPTKPSALSRSPITPPEAEEEEDSIVLVDGNCPRVVEEERDLVILEDIEVISQALQIQIHRPQPQQHYQVPPQTPRRRSQSRNTLHRAVLIRSAQRAVIRAEREREEAEEEMEVLQQAVTGNEESDEEDEERLRRLEERLENMSDSEDEMDVDDPEEQDQYGDEYSDHDEEDAEEQEVEYQEKLKDEGEGTSFYQQKSGWRKSLEKLWPFRSLSPSKDEESGPAQDSTSDSESDSEEVRRRDPESQGTEPEPSDDEGHEEDLGEVDEEPTSLPHLAPRQTPIRRPLGPFMTPQPVNAGQRKMFPPLTQKQLRTVAPRPSLASDGPQRVPIEEPWRVKDIVVPLKSGQSLAAPAPQTSPTRGGRPTLSEEEKKAIQERRRSAVRQPDNFFAGGVPGMTPSKGKPAFFRASASMSPTKGATKDNDENPFLGSSSPVRSSSVFSQTHLESPEEDEVDTRSLLERMKETVEGMKRRRSVAAPGSLAVTPRVQREPETSEEENTPMIQALFVPATAMDVDEVVKEETSHQDEHENQADEDKENKVRQPFSLLRPGAREEVFVRRQSVIVIEKVVSSQDEGLEATNEEQEETNEEMNVDTVPTVIVELTPEVEEPPAPVEEAPPTRGKARLLRAKKSPALEVAVEKDASTSRRTTPRIRSRSPQPVADAEGLIVAEEPKQPEECTSRLRASTRGKKGRSQSRTPQPQPAPAPAHEIVNEEISVDEENPEVAEEEPVPVPVPTKTPARRTRKTTAEPEEKPAPVPDKRGKKASAEPEVAASATARRSRKATVEPEEPPKAEKEKVPVRRGRKPAIKEEPEPAEVAEVTPIPAPTRRGRKPTATPASEPAKPTQLLVPKSSIPKTAPVRKTRTTKAKVAEAEFEPEAEDNDDDPLDTIGVEEEEAIAPTTKAQGKRKADIKQEEPDNAPAIRTATKSTAAAKTPATGTKSRLPRKTPATAPAATSSTEVDKENAQRSRSTSGKSSPAESEGGAPVKVRVSRSTKAIKASATKVKEEVKEPEGDSTGRVMRSTRRTKAT